MHTGYRGLIIALILLVSASIASERVPAEANDQIGQYVQLVQEKNLEPEHVQQNLDSFLIRGPVGTSELQINLDWLAERVDSPASNQEFTIRDGELVVRNDEVQLFNFSLGRDRSFSHGSLSSVYFSERPMWISLELAPNQIIIEADDGNPTGQDMLVSKSWLAQYGIQKPVFRHEDDSVLTPIDDGAFYKVQVPHFSLILIGGMTWTEDEATGIQYRELSDQEYEDSPWNETFEKIYAVLNYGDTAKWESSTEFNLSIPVGSSVLTQSFSYGSELTVLAKQNVATQNGTINLGKIVDETLTHTLRYLTGSVNDTGYVWSAITDAGKGLQIDGYYQGRSVIVLSDSDEFGLDLIPDSAIYVRIQEEAAKQACLGGSVRECRSVGYAGPEPYPPSNGVVYLVLYTGEMEWCHDRGASNWVAGMGRYYNESVAAFSDTIVDIKFGGATCWFLGNGQSPQHDVDYYHDHDGFHLYPFYWIDDQHECGRYVTSMVSSLTHINEHENPDWHVDIRQAIHFGPCWVAEINSWVAGLALGGFEHDSIASDASPYFGTSAHEIAHWFNAEHQFAVCVDNGGILYSTLMATIDDPAGCLTGDASREVRLPQFSLQNQDRINNSAMDEM